MRVGVVVSDQFRAARVGSQRLAHVGGAVDAELCARTGAAGSAAELHEAAARGAERQESRQAE
eukprot:2870921-Rhodomonas_salina.1